jgi:NADH dehydrogenase [ubiquinone] 1 alpha subcomplex assembly factor 1
MYSSASAQNIVFDFSKNDDNGWRIVNDGVMGGLSEGDFQVTDMKAIFSGRVSTDNNGGFTMVRKQFSAVSISDHKSFVLSLKGDGKAYQFRVKSNANQRHSYVYSFTTTTEWQEIVIPFSSLEPRFRGRKVDTANFEGQQIEEIAFLIGNKQKESFQLILDKITVK